MGIPVLMSARLWGFTYAVVLEPTMGQRHTEMNAHIFRHTHTHTKDEAYRVGKEFRLIT